MVKLDEHQYSWNDDHSVVIIIYQKKLQNY